MAFSEDEVAILMNLLKIPAEKQNFEEFRHQIQNLIEKNDNLEKYYLSKNDNTLEKILNNPGLQHLAEFIFDNLKYEDLEICREINQSSKQILDYQMEKPMFLLRKFQGLSKKNKKDWIKVIESVRNSEKDKAISAYLQWNLKKSPKKVDLPCYSNPIVQDDFRMIIDEFVLTDNCYLVTLPNNWVSLHMLLQKNKNKKHDQEANDQRERS